jgi:hypothetical protein
VNELQWSCGRYISLHGMMTCNLIAGLTCTTQLVFLKCSILHTKDHAFLESFLELAHAYVSNATIP